MGRLDIHIPRQCAFYSALPYVYGRHGAVPSDVPDAGAVNLVFGNESSLRRSRETFAPPPAAQGRLCTYIVDLSRASVAPTHTTDVRAYSQDIGDYCGSTSDNASFIDVWATQPPER